MYEQQLGSPGESIYGNTKYGSLGQNDSVPASPATFWVRRLRSLILSYLAAWQPMVFPTATLILRRGSRVADEAVPLLLGRATDWALIPKPTAQHVMFYICIKACGCEGQRASKATFCLSKEKHTRTANRVPMATLRTPFGEFKGKKKNGIVQYLGIKYASLKDQLAIPEMVKEYGNKVIDATEFG